jgi:O-antigen/teichoic acid export membrane protein
VPAGASNDSKAFLAFMLGMYKLMSAKKTFLRGASSAFVIRVVGTGIAFAMHILLARSLSVSDYGVYAYTVAWLNLLALVSLQGLNTASHRYVAQYQSTGQPILLSTFLRFTTLRVAVVSLTISSALYLMSLFFDFENGFRVPFLLMACMLPLFSFLQLFSGYFVGFKQIVLALVPVEIVRPLVIIVGLAVLSAGFSVAIDVISAMQLTLMGTVIALGLSVFFFARNHQVFNCDVLSEKPRKEMATQWHRTAMPLLAASVFSIVLLQSDTIMVGLLVDTRSAGVYSIAWRVAALMSFGIFAVSSIIAPMISELYHGDKLDELRKILRLSSKILLIYAIAAAVFIAFFGAFFLTIFGSEYEGALSILQLLVVYHVVFALAGPAVFLMTMTGNQVVVMQASGITAILNVVLNACLILLFGPIGAAYSTIVTCLLFHIYIVGYMRKHHQLNPCVLNLIERTQS